MADRGPKCPKQRFMEFLAGKSLRITSARCEELKKYGSCAKKTA
jgi:hypothetical protein